MPPEWRRAQEQRGTLQVELQVGQGCAFTARLISGSGAATSVKIAEPRDEPAGGDFDSGFL